MLIPLSRKLATAFVMILGQLLAGCTMTVGAVNPTPNVMVTGKGTYSIDVTRVPDIIDVGRGATLTELKVSLTSGFRNAVGDAYAADGTGDTRLVIESFQASIDEGQIGVMRITYRARWQNRNGDVLARLSGTALPKNPIQTGEGHVRDVIEVMYEQMVEGFDKAQEKKQKAEERSAKTAS